MTEKRERRHRSILQQYSKLLQEWLELPDGPEGFPPLLPPVAVVRDECPLRASPDLSQFLVAPGARPDGLRELRDFTSRSSRLTVLDPYFFSGVAGQAADIAEDFARTARITEGTLKAVHVVRNKHRDTRAVFAAISRKLRPSGVRLTDATSEELHDRVWIADGQRGVVVGTSFNGLGTRAAFILPLPQADLDAILEFLYGRGLVRRPARRAKP